MDVTDVEQAKALAIEASMKAQGVPTDEPAFADYFGFEQTEVVPMPDSRQWVEIRVLNEGQRRKYLNSVNRDVRVQRGTGDAFMRLSSGDEKRALLESAIVNWNLRRGGQLVPFNERNLREFLDKADPRIIDRIEKAVRKANPWLQQDWTVEEIDEEIAELQELRQRKLDEAEGKDA